MGLFSLFKRKDQSANQSASKSGIKAERVEKEQNVPTSISVLDLDYTSPSGGYLNYGIFSVSGTNSSTKRRSGQRYKTRDSDAAIQLAIADGFEGPFEVEIIKTEEATEKQINYAINLGAVVPDGACKEDLSAILSRILEDDAPPKIGLAQYAHEEGICFSRYVGQNDLLGHIWSRSLFHKSSIYLYFVYLSTTGHQADDPNRSPIASKFISFYEAVSSDASLTKSLEGRSASELSNPNKGTSIYKAAIKFLID